MHTAPPLPPFIHCAQDSPQPPLATPAQFNVPGAAASHVPDAGRPNSWTTGAGEDDEEESAVRLPPPLPPLPAFSPRDPFEKPQGPPPAPLIMIDPDAVTAMVALEPVVSGVTDELVLDPLGRVRLSPTPELFVKVKLSPAVRVTIGAESAKVLPPEHVTVMVEGDAAEYADGERAIAETARPAVAPNVVRVLCRGTTLLAAAVIAAMRHRTFVM